MDRSREGLTDRRVDRSVDRHRDRRGISFVVAAVLCFALIPVAEGYAWVPATVGAVYVALAVASGLDARARRRL